jgi:hypothetical protein
MGDVYQRTGRIELAREEWRKALTGAMEDDLIARLKAKLDGEGKK